MDPGRDLDLERAFLEHAAGAVTASAWMVDDPPGPRTARARLSADELAEARAGDMLDATAAAAVLARGRRLAGLDSVAPAFVADEGELNRHGPLDPGCRLLELDLDLGRDICAASAARACGDPEHVVAEEGREDVGEAPEVERSWAEAAAAQPGMTEAVVETPRLGLGQHLVGLDDFAKALPRIGSS
jgi:hypothetical protein